MSTPELSPWGERLRERTEPLAPDDAEHGYAHAHLSGAMAEALERVAEIYDPEEGLPGSPLLDVDRCPDWALPWLAQLVGVTIPTGMSTVDVREGIRAVAGWKRGTPAAMRAAAQAHLTGGKTVYFRERDATGADPPYTLEVVTLDKETPATDRALANLLTNPAGADNTSGWQVFTGVTPNLTLVSVSEPDFSGGGMRIGWPSASPASPQAQQYIPYAIDGNPGPNMRPLKEGAYYAIRGKWRITRKFVNSPNPVTFGLRVDNAAGGAIGGPPQTVNSAKALQDYAVGEVFELAVIVGPITSAMKFGGPQPTSNGAPGGGTDGELIAGNFMVAEVDGPSAAIPAYGDGDSPGWRWTGTPHGSASERIPTNLVRDALLRQKPAGLVLTYRTVEGWDYQELAASGPDPYSALDDTYATYRLLREGPT